MIIKSMSRKHPSFEQLIDYVQSERKAKSQRFSVFHNVYSRDRAGLAREFSENAKFLKFRKNGVYLYHEIISITRSRQIPEDQQKAILQKIVLDYLALRAKNNLAYGTLHEDRQNQWHFHLVISANESQDQNRVRLSKATFHDIQTRLEKWVLENHPELEQKAVFRENKTEQQRQEAERTAHVSNKGAELKRRTGRTANRDQVKQTLEEIFSNARDGRHFSELLDTAGFRLYQHGKQFGIVDEDGTKYRFSRLGLMEEWEALDKRMMDNFQKATPSREQQQTKTERTVQDSMSQQTEQRETQENKRQKPEDSSLFEQVKDGLKDGVDEFKARMQGETPDQSASLDPIEAERQRRLNEMQQLRNTEARTEDSTSHKNQSS